MFKHFKTSIFVVLLLVMAISTGLTTGAVSAQRGADVNPNTPVSEDGELPMPEAIGARTQGPERGTGEKLAKPYRIPQEHLDAPELTGGFAEASAESVIGVDSRARITATTVYPNRAIAYLYITFPNGSKGSCTGWFIGANTVATAGHCVYDTVSNRWASSILVYPGANGANAPYGYTTAKKLYSVTGWTVSENWEYDYGVIKTSASMGNTVGYFGFRWQSSNTFSGSYTVRGYPGDKAYRTLWTMSGPIYTLGYARKLWYQMDTYGGQSGSPIYHTFNSVCCYGVGVHAYGASTISGIQYNSGTRLTQAAYNNLVYWKGLP